ncbi:MAG TPA: ABC transporter ATP-binding protein [Anaerolineae bacterium]|nr:ABC transporter ATP-binding protein [Anaerolineae bacterium]
MLEVTDLHVHYGVIHALKGVSFYLNEGEIVALIGANGAGKSTLLNTISGILEATGGKIEYLDEVISNSAPQDIVNKGVTQVPEGRKIFPSMSVIENLEMGAYSLENRKGILNKIDAMLEKFPLIKDRGNQLGGTLSGGEQQMLAIARGLMADPKLMLLDEPSMGLAPVLVEQVFDTIQEINKQGTSILLVEQNAQMALSIANRAYVLETGNITLGGTGRELLNNPQIIKSYLGGQ